MAPLSISLGNFIGSSTLHGGSTPTEQLLLDQYPNAAAAYSLRALSTATVDSSVVRVRRSLDNTEQDFTATQITDGTLETFCILQDGFVTTWYDQSGDSNNSTQTSASNQPKIVSNGVLIDDIVFLFDGINDNLSIGSFSANSVATISFWVKLTDTIESGFSGNQRPYGKAGNFEARWNSDGAIVFDLFASSSLISTKNSWLNTEWHNITVVYDQSTNQSGLYVNGILDSTGTVGSDLGPSGNYLIGATYNNTGNLKGKIGNFLIYNRALDSTDVLGIFNDTKSDFGL